MTFNKKLIKRIYGVDIETKEELEAHLESEELYSELEFSPIVEHTNRIDDSQRLKEEGAYIYRIMLRNPMYDSETIFFKN